MPSVGIDYAIVIQGKDGIIISSKMYKYSSNERWSNSYIFDTFVCDVRAAKNAKELETQVAKNDLGNFANMKVLYWMKGWLGKDASDTLVDLGAGRDDGSRYYHQRAQISFNATAKDIRVGSGVIGNGLGGGDIRCLCSGDMNNDGYEDLISGDAGGDIYIWQNPGANAWTTDWTQTRVTQNVGYIVRDVEVGDLDNDGDLDVVAGISNGNLIIYRNPDWHSYTITSVGSSINGARFVDLDNDGCLDIIFCDSNNYVRAVRNQLSMANPWGAGGWSSVKNIGTPTTYGEVSGVDFGDFDSDGFIDVVSGSRGSWLGFTYYGYVCIWKNPRTNIFTSGTWSRNIIFTSSNDVAITGLGVADLDNDGDLDITHFPLYPSQTGGNVNLVVSQNPGFANAFSTSPWNSNTIDTLRNLNYIAPRSVSVGDFDLDGWTDIAVVSSSAFTTNVRIYENTHAPFSSGGWILSFSSSTSSTGTGVCAVAKIDIDIDGDYDIGVGDTNDQVFAFKNNLVHRSMPFSSGLDMSGTNDAGGDITGIAVGDLDNDGDMDVVAVDIGSGAGAPQDAKVYGYCNPGTASISSWRTWERSELYTSPYDYYDVKLADFDNDGYLDMVQGQVWTNGNSYPHVNKNPGGANVWTQTWVEDWDQPLCSLPVHVNSIDVGDLDRDGKIDVVYGLSNGSVILCQRIDVAIDNNGDWLSNQYIYWTPTGCTSVNSVSLGDLDNDGYLDVVVGGSTSSGGMVVICRNDRTPFNGLGSDENTIATLSYRVNAVALLNYDGDGDLDIASGDACGSEQLKLWQNPNGTSKVNPFRTAWVTGPQMSTDGAINCIASGDLDNDGDPDIVSGDASRWVYTHRNPRVGGSSWITQSIGNVGGAVTDIAVANLDIKSNDAPLLDPDNGDLDIITGDDGGSDVGNVYIFENIGAQCNISLVEWEKNPSHNPSTSFVVCEFTVTHNGISTDNEIEIASVRFQYRDSSNSADLTSAEVNALISSHSLYLDDGDGVFEGVGVETVVPTSVTITASGQVTFTVTESKMAVIGPGLTNTYYYYITLTSGASGATPNSFRVILDPDGVGTNNWNEIEDNSSDKIVSIEPTSSFVSPAYYAVPEYSEIAVPMVVVVTISILCISRRKFVRRIGK